MKGKFNIGGGKTKTQFLVNLFAPQMFKKIKSQFDSISNDFSFSEMKIQENEPHLLALKDFFKNQ
jgi:hypothetical protein